MSILKVEPAGVVTSLEELFAIAYALEHESALRYAALAERMRSAGDSPLAETFDRLAHEERSHLDSVVAWSKTERGTAPDAAHLRWALPETFNDEEAGTSAPQIQTPYGALAMAVRNEERAFAFWSYVAAHAATLRRARRNAYHADRFRRASSTSQADFDMAVLETRLADLLNGLPAKLAQTEVIRQFARESLQNATQLANATIALPPTQVSASVLDDPVVLAELLVDRYLDAADRLQEETTLKLAQSLAARAIHRLARLRAQLGASSKD
jgi:rubrerythrin